MRKENQSKKHLSKFSYFYYIRKLTLCQVYNHQKFKEREGMRYWSCKKYQEKKMEVSGKEVIGIDPEKEKHQVL